MLGMYLSQILTSHRRIIYCFSTQLTIKSYSKTYNEQSRPFLLIQLKGHSYESSIANRLKGTACPYCANKKVLKGYNDLVTTNPEIAKEWNYEKNTDSNPADFTIGSGKKVWWKCSNCGKEWISVIYTRKTGPLCGKCKRKKINED